MDTGNKLCTACGYSPAHVFCTCTSPETLLCSDCVCKHTSRLSRQGHCTWPVASLAYYQDPGYISRLESFFKLKDLAVFTQSEVDTVCSELITRVTEIQSNLTSVCEDKIAYLREIKTDLETALEEVEQTLPLSQPELNTRYGPALRQLVDQNQALPSLFSYEFHTISVESLIDIQVQLPEFDTAQRALYFPSVYYNSLTLYNTTTRQADKHTIPINFCYGGSYILLDNNTNLLCFGGKIASQVVYSLDIFSLKYTNLPNSIYGRFSPGVTKTGKFVYIFGGQDELYRGLRSCEKWEVNDMKWTEIAQMAVSRACFTPCNFHSYIYLVATSTAETRSIETFHPITEKFQIIPLTLPMSLRLECASVAFVVNEELCLITREKQIACCRLEKEWEFRVKEMGIGCWSSTPPRVIGREVFIACRDQVLRFSLETYSFL